MKFKPNFKNRPPHYSPESGFYFITSRTVSGQWFLQPDKYKKILLNVIQEKTKKFACPLIAYVILNNHYHLILEIEQTKVWTPRGSGDQTLVCDEQTEVCSPTGLMESRLQSADKQAKAWTPGGGSNKTLPKLMREINGASARYINDADAVIKRKIWWNYFDKYLRDEEDFFKHLNYIHQNPIKHGFSDKMDIKFSSYRSWLRQRGKEYLDDCFREYPIVDFAALNDEF